MVLSIAFEEADKMRDLINTQPPTSLDLDVEIWREIWSRLQTGNNATWSWDSDVAVARKYIDHMMACTRLAECFERGDVIDESLYKDIGR